MDDPHKNSQHPRPNIRAEIIGGVTTFLTMAYIIFVNPSILSLETVPADVLNGLERMDKQALIAATCIVSAIATIIVGIFAKAPIAMAPGMGLNAFFAYSLMLGDRVPWRTALGVVFLSGLMFLILTLVGLRRKLVEAIPPGLVSAISVGIGLFITFMGLVNLGVIVKNDATLVAAGELTPTVLIGFCGLLVMLFFEARRIKGSLLIGIVVATVLAAIFGYIDRPEHWMQMNVDITPVAFQLNIIDALTWTLFGSIFSLMFIDMFDSVGTLVACCHKAEMVDKNNRIRGLDRLLGPPHLMDLVGKGEQGPRMTGAQQSLLNDLLDRRRQAEQTQRVSHRAATDSDAAGNLLLRETEIRSQILECSSLFERGQITALQVLHQRQLELIIGPQALPYHRRNGRQAGQPRRPPASLAGNQHIAILAILADQDRLQDSVLAD